MESSMKTRTSASLTKRFNVKHAQMDLFWPIGSKFLTNAVTQIYDKKLTLPLEAKISGKLETSRTQSFLNYGYSVELPSCFELQRKYYTQFLWGSLLFAEGIKERGGGGWGDAVFSRSSLLFNGRIDTSRRIDISANALLFLHAP